jgi:hypothetical protein
VEREENQSAEPRKVIRARRPPSENHSEFLIGALIREDKKETKLGPQKDIAGETFLRPERLFHKEDYPMQVILMREHE